ncbi:hypothetical protein BGZ58_007896 [Dissophora ornata]|nr:hypothetical protein BGZ58_007896 [Dissophora ornata]
MDIEDLGHLARKPKVTNIKECPKQPHDPAVTKLCEECGWAGPRESWPELPPTDSDEESSDLSDEGEDADTKEESEEAKAKKLAANTPKVQVQLQGLDSTNGDSRSQNIESEQQRIGCNGSCQTREHQNDTADPAVGGVADIMRRVQL